MKRIVVLNRAELLETVYDYYGFPDEMYQIEYRAKGSTEIAHVLEDRFRKRDIVSLDKYGELAPYAHVAVPRPEHFVPLFIAMGSGDKNRKPRVLNQTYEFGTLSNLCIKFCGSARERALEAVHVGLPLR